MNEVRLEMCLTDEASRSLLCPCPREPALASLRDVTTDNTPARGSEPSPAEPTRDPPVPTRPADPELGLESLESKGRPRAGHLGRISTSQSGDTIPSSWETSVFGVPVSAEQKRPPNILEGGRLYLKSLSVGISCIYKTPSQKHLDSCLMDALATRAQPRDT